MLTRRIIPCLDVRDGRVVKGVKFENLRDMGSPVEHALAYEAQGADELVVLDVAATTDARLARLETVSAVRSALSIPLTVGGGVGSVDDAASLLDAGADKVSVNTAAVRDPSLLTRLAERFGAQCVVLAIDAGARGRNRWTVRVRSGASDTGIDAVGWAARGVEHGAGEILLTSLDRDGTREGYDVDLLSAVSRAVTVPVIASGGANDATHMVDAFAAGADAVLAASLFHERDMTVGDVKSVLATAGVEVRS